MLRVAKDRFGGTLFQDHTLVHEHDALAHIAGEGHLMRHDEHGHALVRKVLHDGEHLADHFRVKRACRLVEQKHLGVHGKCTCNGDTLLLAAGELTRLGVDVGRHADLFQIPHGLLLRLGLTAAKHLHLADHAVFQNRHIIEQIKRLEHHADVGAVFRGVDAFTGDIFAVVENVAARWRFEQIHAAQQRRFAGAGRADDGDHVAFFDIKVDIAQDFVRAKGLAQVPDLKNIVCHISDPPCCVRI